MKSKHILFEDDIFDGIQWTITQDKVDNFIKLWNEGASAAKIAAKLKYSQLQVALLVLDLGALGKIKPRKGGLLG